MKTREANKLFNKIGKPILKAYIHSKYSFTFNKDSLRDIKPPYLILSNHVNNLDPFLITATTEHPVHFVTSDEQFKYKVRAFFLEKVIGGIPKSKYRADVSTVKDIIKLTKNNNIVGIFPEGSRSWDGETEELVYSTAKLVKKLRIPVVCVVIEGAHLARPRWSIKNRRGKIHLNYKYSLTSDEVKKMTDEEIYKKLSEDLYHNEYAMQKKEMNTYISNKLAERLELYLFTCPHCTSIGTLVSSNDILSCTNCNYTVKFDKYGFFNKVNEELHYTFPSPWNEWQLENLEKIIIRASNSSNKDYGEVIIEDHNVTVFLNKRFKPLEKYFHGSILFKENSLYLIESGQEVKRFAIEKISGISIQYSNEFEFYYDEEFYRFKFDEATTSAYKWTSTIKIAQRFSTK